jgi:hypothetical protein
MTQDRLVVGRGRKQTILLVLQQRHGIAAHFESHMGWLGIEQRAKPMPTLSDYLANKREKDGE